MSAKASRIIGIILLLLSFWCLSLAGNASARNSAVVDHISSTYEGSNGSYTCTGSPKDVADDINAAYAAQARATDSATGSEYLRYVNNVITVSPADNSTCRITVEDLGRVNDGAFIFLGPGFTPSSPSGSSGGSSGGSGVK